MPAANPLQAAPLAAFHGEARATAGGYEGGASVDTDVTPSDNTNVHVAGLVLGALGVVVVLHLLGFRFAVDVGVTA